MASSAYVEPELLVETGWLAEHLGEFNLVVVDMDLPQGYQKGRIPGAMGVPHHFLKGEQSPQHVMDADAFKGLMESIGVGGGTLVVGYDNNRGLTAARLWWVLNYYGHTNVKVLNGGWRKWIQEGRPVEAVATGGPRRPAAFVSQVRREVLATVDDVKVAYDTPDAVVWDVRSEGEYTGAVDRGNARKGHVPGARHLEWLNLVHEADHTFKAAPEMRLLLEEIGVTPDETVYTY